MKKILLVGRHDRRFAETFLAGLDGHVYFSDKIISISDGEGEYVAVDVAQIDFPTVRFFDVIIIKNNDFRRFEPCELLRSDGLVFVWDYKRPFILNDGCSCIKFGCSEYDTVTYTSYSEGVLRVCLQRPVADAEVCEWDVPIAENACVYAALCAAVIKKVL